MIFPLNNNRPETGPTLASPAETPVPTILVVEDDRQVLDFLEKALRRGGYRVTTTANGQEAVRRVKQGGINLVVTDLCMPQMDGIELVRHVREAGILIPVIAISGALVGYTRDMLRAVELLGASFTLEKPFSPIRLLEVVRQLLGAPGGPAGEVS